VSEEVAMPDYGSSFNQLRTNEEVVTEIERIAGEVRGSRFEFRVRVPPLETRNSKLSTRL
jgi:hypothetical protein